MQDNLATIHFRNGDRILIWWYLRKWPCDVCLRRAELSCINTWLIVYPKKYAHGFVVLCFVVVMQSFIMNSHEVFIHIHQGCFAGTGAINRLPQCQLALGQSIDCHSASEVSLMDMGKSVNVEPQQSTAKQKPCAYFLGYNVSKSQ